MKSFLLEKSLGLLIVGLVLAIASAFVVFGTTKPAQALVDNNNYLSFAIASTTSATVTTSSSLVIASSTNPQQRTYAIISNDSTGNVVWLSLGLPAVVSTGIRLNPGASYTINPNNLFTGSVYAIGTTTVTLDVEAFQN